AIETIVVAALATATNVTSDVVTPALAKTGVLPFGAATIDQLLAQPIVDPAQFPAQIAAFTQVAKAGALFTGPATNATAFNFVLANAVTFRWLDTSMLPLTPVSASPYAAFEALLRALKLQQRQSARTPKLFDILGQWQLPGQLPADVATAIGGPTILVAGGSDTTPITITTGSPHRLQARGQGATHLGEGKKAGNRQGPDNLHRPRPAHA